MKVVLALFLAVSFSAFAGDPAKTREACKDPDSQCWCSVKCGYRDKTDKDHPIYIENDRNGKFCYCKQWDLDHFEDNCIEGENLQEPPGAQ